MRFNEDASATYKKLDNGEWGVWTDLPDLKPGQTISVTTAKGRVKTEKLDKRIWQDDEGTLSLWSLRSSDE